MRHFTGVLGKLLSSQHMHISWRFLVMWLDDWAHPTKATHPQQVLIIKDIPVSVYYNEVQMKVLVWWVYGHANLCEPISMQDWLPCANPWELLQTSLHNRARSRNHIL